ncbi:MAG: alpha/beta fold hydrolase [Sphingobacteriales bacterium]|nr:MAG: alpha/beta fold hydrolase [Sphingobacteriales bacterium]
MTRNKLFAFLLLGFSTTTVIAQSRLDGDWQGVLKVPGNELHVVFHIKDSTATMDVIEQKAKGIAASGVIMKGDSVRINVAKLGAFYAGAIKSADLINGSWYQGGAALPMDIERGKELPAEVKLNRPQTPQPPYSYISEDVTFQNGDKSIQYGATLTLPNGAGPFPAVLLLNGSGLQNRDGEILGHKPFAVIADHLTKSGYAVLRVDDRGTGQTTGPVTDVTTADFAKDANAALDYLQTRKEINKKKIGLAGHSEGGIIAQMLATSRKDIDFVIFLASPAIKIRDLMLEQNAAILKNKPGMTEEGLKEYLMLYNSVTGAVVASKSAPEVKAGVLAAVKQWIDVTDPEIVLATIGVNDKNNWEGIGEQIAQNYLNAWTRYFLAYDPQPYLQKINAKVLALNGSKDVQVLSSSNLKGMEAGLAKSKSKYTIKELAGLNHLFQLCIRCTVDEYGKLEESFAPVALIAMTEWLDKNVK